ncbi:MAG: NAD(P)-dependent oxidoreductase [Candidatus Latescibacteria bacterium]|nr:NAD(P)-dependent oxidoreductase [Candidatus Latescibacterota bacterium]
MKRILVTGAAGLIGSYLCRRLSQNNKIWGLIRPNSKPENIPQMDWIQCNLAKPVDIKKLPSELDVIIHLAQSNRYKEFPDSAPDVFNVNIRSTFELLDYGRKIGIKQFVYGSSGGIYGSGEYAFKDTDHITIQKPLSFYNTSKYISELMTNNYTAFFSTAILRFFFVYGKGQKKSMLIPRLINNVRTGVAVILEGKDGVIINPIYIDDVIAAVTQIVNRELSITVNIGGPQNLSIRRIAEIIGEIVGKKPVFEFTHDECANNLIGDITTMTKYMDPPMISFKEGLNKMIYDDAIKESE